MQSMKEGRMSGIECGREGRRKERKDIDIQWLLIYQLPYEKEDCISN
jgi:hypothetical protein